MRPLTVHRPFAILTGLLLLLVGLPLANASTYSNGFETNTAGWCSWASFSSIDTFCTGDARGTITRQPSGYANTGGYADGVASASGGYHARLGLPTNCVTQASGGGPVNRCRGAYTDWNNSDYAFPADGYVTRMDIYLDVSYAASHTDCFSCNRSRFDISSAISTPTGDHLRDFAFNVGTDPTGLPQFVVSTSQNANRDSTFPSNPGKEPVNITQSGWYTFRWHFFNASGTLAVDMDITPVGQATAVGSWGLPNRSSATRGDTADATSSAGCALYGYFSNQEIPDLAIDNAERVGCGPVAATGTIHVTKFYDANANGVRDAGEVDIIGWNVTAQGGAGSVSGLTPAVFTLSPGTYYVAEANATQTNWLRTTPGNITVVLLAGTDQTVSFGNVCIGSAGARSLGFWSSKNGQALVTASDLAALSALHLRTASGANFDPSTYAQLKAWLLKATATNMAYALSAQLAAVELDVLHGFANGTALVYAPGVTGANSAGFITVSALIAAADSALAADGYTPSGDPNRAPQEALKNALDGIAMDRTFVQASACAFSFG